VPARLTRPRSRSRALGILFDPFNRANFWWQLYNLAVRATIMSCFVLVGITE
jgi:hypothetical protein